MRYCCCLRDLNLGAAVAGRDDDGIRSNGSTSSFLLSSPLDDGNDDDVDEVTVTPPSAL